MNNKNCNSCKHSFLNKCQTLKENETFKQIHSARERGELSGLDAVIADRRFKESFVCDNYQSRYIEFPVEISEIKRETEIYTLQQNHVGKMVRVRPCDKACEGKTYLGLFLGDLPAGINASLNPESKALTLSYMNNPAMFVFELKRIVYGMESWWSVIETEADLTDITDTDIKNVWYVKALEQLSSAEKAAASTERRNITVSNLQEIATTMCGGATDFYILAKSREPYGDEHYLTAAAQRESGTDENSKETFSIRVLDSNVGDDSVIVTTTDTTVASVTETLKGIVDASIKSVEENNPEVEIRIIKEAVFVSVWDDGTGIVTSCSVDMTTREVFDIEVCEDTQSLNNLEGEYVRFENSDETHDVCHVDELEKEGDTRFWYR